MIILVIIIVLLLAYSIFISYRALSFIEQINKMDEERDEELSKVVNVLSDCQSSVDSISRLPVAVDDPEVRMIVRTINETNKTLKNLLERVVDQQERNVDDE